MNDNLNVKLDELAKISESTNELLNSFQNTSNEFNNALKDLGNYWQGEDYNAMITTLNGKINPLINSENGTIVTLMKDISNELNQKKEDYTSIRNTNMSYWG